MIVCNCNNISERKIRQAVEAGISTMQQLKQELAVATCCGKCYPHANETLRSCLNAAERKTPHRPESPAAGPVVFHSALAAA